MFLLYFQGAGIYSKSIKQVEDDIQNVMKRVNELAGIKESDTGLAPPALWDLAADKQTLQSQILFNMLICTGIYSNIHKCNLMFIFVFINLFYSL